MFVAGIMAEINLLKMGQEIITAKLNLLVELVRKLPDGSRVLSAQSTGHVILPVTTKEAFDKLEASVESNLEIRKELVMINVWMVPAGLAITN